MKKRHFRAVLLAGLLTLCLAAPASAGFLDNASGWFGGAKDALLNLKMPEVSFNVEGVEVKLGMFPEERIVGLKATAEPDSNACKALKYVPFLNSMICNPVEAAETEDE